MNKEPPPPYYPNSAYPGVHQYPYPPQVQPSNVGWQPQNIPPPPSGYPYPSYGTTTTQQPTSHTATVIVQQPEVIVIGGCPSCRIGVLEENFSCMGICCAIVFFPAGILCCLLMRERTCTNCGARFDY